LSSLWHITQCALKLTSPTSDRFPVETCDPRQLLVIRTIRLLRQEANKPASLWLIQSAQQQVYLMVKLDGFPVGSCLANVAFALVKSALCFTRHKTTFLLEVA
jgi:hypothetical protein